MRFPRFFSSFVAVGSFTSDGGLRRGSRGRMVGHCPNSCEREGVVVGDEAPLSGVAQVVSHGVKVVGAHGEDGREQDEEVRVEVKGEVEENRRQPHMCMA